jgi:hypothetical protein
MGNHNWVEVWLPETQSWQSTEFGGGPNDFNNGWLVADAARAIPGSLIHAIFSTSWKPTGAHFPMVWAMDDSSVPAVDVTTRYLELGKTTLPAIGECELRIEVMAQGEVGSKARRPLDVQIQQGDVIIATGKSPTQTDDMNHFLTVKVKQGQIYQLIAIKNGKPTAIERIQVSDKEESKKITLQVES